jgi:hypothetical protein
VLTRHTDHLGKFRYTLLLLLSPCLFGQATGSISGTITDATGSVVPGAKVSVSSEATGLSRNAITDGDGHYLVPLLPVSTFTVRVEQSGFQLAEEKNIALQVDEHREINFKLVPASVTQTVEVSATAVSVQTTNASLGQVINSQEVAQLPLNGRDFVQLATLTPGTTQETNPSSFFNGGPSSEVSARGSFSLSVGGSRANSTDWLLDGNDNNELTAGGISILPSIDAIQEFKVLTYNYSAEWGTRAGPTVLVTTKSGSNAFHGSLFEFFRNTDLDARSFFATETEQFNLNQYGGSIGGPIRKDKTFFFGDYEGKNQRHGIPFTGVVPSVAMRTGDFTDDPFGSPRSGFLTNPYATGTSTAFQCDPAGNPLPAVNGVQAAGVNCNKIPASMINPIAQKMINLYPLPNANNAALGYNYTNVPVRKLDENKFDFRLDHNFSEKDEAFARFSYDQATSFVPGGSPGWAEQGTFASTQDIANHGRNAAVSETHVFSPNTINQINAGYNRIFNYITSFGTGTCAAQALGIPGANLGGISCGLTSTQITGYWSLGDRGYSPFQGGTNVFTVSDSLHMIRGNHDLEIGGGFRANQMNVMAEGFQDGFWIFGLASFTGDPMADFVMGNPNLGIHDQTFNGSTTGRRWKMYRPFVEDNWRVSKDLTLNLGLAWALTTPITEAADRQANFDFATGKLLVAGQGADSAAGVQMDKTAFEPRIGVAWKPAGSSKTVIRAGYAIFHDSSWNQGAQGLWQNPPYYAEGDVFAFGPVPTYSISQGFPIFTSPPELSSFTGTLFSQNLDFKQGRVQQYNVNLEQQVPGGVVFTFGYAGSRSTHILVDGNNLNVGSPAACGVVPGYNLGCGPGGSAFGEPYPQYGTISNINDVGRATYNSLQIKAETRSTHGIYALIGYTYSRAKDSGFADGLGSNFGATYWPLPKSDKLDWALSQINLNQAFTASVIYQLPFGRGKKFGSSWNAAANAILGAWEVTVIEKATSGFPIYVLAGSNNSGVNFVNPNGSSLIRPNQICNAELSRPSLSEWFNTNCFVEPPAGELGNAPRGAVSGPGFINTDFSVIKHFPIHEAAQLDFRTEIFNLFNHPQFGTPGSSNCSSCPTMGTPGFGAINTTVNNPRLVQFAAKLVF